MSLNLRTAANWLFSLSALAALGCSSSSPTPPPAAPTGVSAIAGDQSVTVSWESSAGATGYRVYYNPDSSGAVTTASFPVDAGTALFLKIPGLVNGTKYRFAVAARGLTGEGPLSAEVTGTPVLNAPIAVASTSPLDLATGVPLSPPIAVTFNRAATPGSVTGQAAAGACAGSVQLSKDNFSTCAAIGATATASGGDATFTFTLAAPLAPMSTYQLRVTTAVRDANGIALVSQYTQPTGFTTGALLGFVSVTPADGATAVPVQTTVTLVFDHPLDATTAKGNTTDSACTGALQLSTGGFAANSCVKLASATVTGATVVLTPAAPLPPGALVQARATTALLDTDGNGLSATHSSAGFTTQVSFAVASALPAANAMQVPLNSNVQVTFNRAATASSITAHTAAQSGCGTISLTPAGGACIAFSAQPTSTDGKTFTLTPAAALAGSTTYTLAVGTGALDAAGNALGAAFSSTFTTGTAVDMTPPGEVTQVTAIPALQSIALAWTNPGDPDFSLVRIHLCGDPASCSNSAPLLASVPGAPGASGSTILTGLVPSTSYLLRLTTVDQSGNESAGSGDSSVSATTQFTGAQTASASQPDFLPGQKGAAVGAGVGGGTISVWFTWSSGMLYAAIGNSDGTALLTSSKDVFWIAVDTDPDADLTGETRTPSVGTNDVIWPFKADYVVQLIPAGLASSVQVRAAGGCALIHQPPAIPVGSDCGAASGALTFDGSAAGASGLAEVAIPASAFGGAAPAKVRLAFAALDGSNGYAYALAPANPHAVDVIGFFGSATASFDPGANVFKPASAATAASSATSPVTAAASLVKLSVQVPAGGSSPTLKGSLHPLSYTLTDVSFALRDDGTGGDATAGDGIYSGLFNFGQSAQELFFKLGQTSNGAQADEFPSGTDRVWTLSGGADTIPALTYATPYSATHSFVLNVSVANVPDSPPSVVILGDQPEIGDWAAPFDGSGARQAGAPLAFSTASTWTGSVTFMNHDFVSGNGSCPGTQGTADGAGCPLSWKAVEYAGGTSYEPGNNHTMNDDVLNQRQLSYSWGDGTGF